LKAVCVGSSISVIPPARRSSALIAANGTDSPLNRRVLRRWDRTSRKSERAHGAGSAAAKGTRCVVSSS